MGIKTYNPYTPSRRNMSGYDFEEIMIMNIQKLKARYPEGHFDTECSQHREEGDI